MAVLMVIFQALEELIITKIYSNSNIHKNAVKIFLLIFKLSRNGNFSLSSIQTSNYYAN